VFHGTLKTKPGGQRNAPYRLQRNIAEINGHQTKTAALKEQVGDPQPPLDKNGRRVPDLGPRPLCVRSSSQIVDNGLRAEV